MRASNQNERLSLNSKKVQISKELMRKHKEF